MRVLVTGDREWSHSRIIETVLEGFLFRYGESLTVVEGCARGADRVAHKWHEDDPDLHDHYPADWEQYGKGAGPIRNREMLATGPHVVIAFHDDLEHSKGTKDMVEIATKAGIPTYHIRKVN